MQFWTFLHISFLFASVGLSFGVGWYALVAAWRRDLGALRGYVRISTRTEPVGGILGTLGIVCGVIAALVGQLDLFQSWLVIAYVLVAVSLTVVSLSSPLEKRMKMALAANEGDEPGPELEAALANPWIYISGIASTAIIGAIIAVMVFKPTF